MWVIVKKTDYGEVDYLPKSWLLESGKEAKYPLLNPSDIKRLCDSNHNLRKIACEIIQVSRYDTKEYDTWESAYDNCIRFARGRRSKSSSEREVKGRGKRDKRKKRLTSSEESASSEEDVFPEEGETSSKTAKLEKLKEKLKEAEHRPVPPAPVRSSAEHSRKQQPENNSRHSVNTQSPSSMAVSSGSPVNLNSPRTSKNQGENSKCSPKKAQNPSPTPDSVKKQLFNKKPKPPSSSITIKKSKCKLGKKIKHPCPFRLDSGEMEAIMHTLCALGGDVQELKFRLKTLKKSSARQSEMEEVQQVEIPAELEQKFKFPIELKEVLDEFEKTIQSDQDIFKTLVKAYTWLHRNDSCVANTARGIAKAVVAENLLSTFSLQGGRAKNKPHKRPFNALALYSLIIQVVKKIWKVFDDPQKEANNTLGPFLTGCKSSVDALAAS